MRILDLLFGNKIIKTDSFFGEIESFRIKKKDLRKFTTNTHWTFDYKIDSFNKSSYIILPGNLNGVNSKLKRELIYFIENWSNLYSKELDKLINSTQLKKRIENWNNEYYISCITSLDDSDTNLEINFESLNNKDNKYFGFDFVNREIKNIE